MVITSSDRPAPQDGVGCCGDREAAPGSRVVEHGGKEARLVALSHNYIPDQDGKLQQGVSKQTEMARGPGVVAHMEFGSGSS